MASKSKLGQALDALEARLLAMKDWAEWGTQPFEVITIRLSTGTTQDDRAVNWESRTEAATMAQDGKIVILLQALNDFTVDPDVDGVSLDHKFQIDLQHRTMLTKLMEPQYATECVIRWLHDHQLIESRACTRTLKIKSGTGGLSTDGKFFITKITAEWESILPEVTQP